MSIQVKMTVLCDLKVAALVEDVLEGTASVVTIENVDESTSPKKKKNFHYNGGLKNKGISGPNCVLETIKNQRDNKATMEQLTTAGDKYHFAQSSIRNSTARLVKANKIERLASGHYKLK